MKYRLAEGVRLVADSEGGLLVREYPLRTLRCNSSLWRLLCSAESEGHITSCLSVMETLAGAGLLERVWEKLPMEKCPTISVIIPVKDREDELRHCLDSLQPLDYPAELLEIIVVDDGSTDNSAEVALQAGAACIPSGGVGAGPAAARNRGAKTACGELLAFLDSDCTASPGWLRELAAPFLEHDIAAVGGCVRGYFTASHLDRYEDAMSSLTLGAKENWAGAGDDSFYLPSCNLLVRRDYFLELGGFDDEMHVGEDVDLCYRLRDKGFRIGYIPVGTIFHAHRNRVVSFMSRRFAYGTSEAWLQRKHSARHKKMQLPLLSFVILLLLPTLFVAPVLCIFLIICLLFADVGRQYSALLRANKRPSVSGILCARSRTIFSLGYYSSYHVIRYYLPILLGLSALNPYLASFAALIFFWAASVDYVVKKAALPFPSFSLIYFLEQIAYSCGVFWGCCKRTSFTSYRVVFRFNSIGEMERNIS